MYMRCYKVGVECTYTRCYRGMGGRVYVPIPNVAGVECTRTRCYKEMGVESTNTRCCKVGVEGTYTRCYMGMGGGG